MNLENYYVSGLPIRLDKKLGYIYQPTIKELFTKGVTNLDVVSPFVAIEKVYHNSNSTDSKFKYVGEFQKLSKLSEQVNVQDEEQLSVFNIFNSLIDSLKIIYKTDDISWTELGEDSSILIRNSDGTHLIYEDNFDRLSNVILEMFGIDKDTLFKEVKDEEWKENTGSEYERKMIQYFKKKEKKKKEEETIGICDYINVVVHLGRYTYISVIDMTYWQLMNSFKTLIALKNHKEDLGYRWSFKFNIEEKQKSWIKEIKIKNSTHK